MLRLITLSTALIGIATVASAQVRLPLDGVAAGGQPGGLVTLSITAPADAAATISFGSVVNWTPTIPTKVFADTLVWGYTAPTDSTVADSFACQPIVTDLTGKIGFLRRGGCAFSTKAQNAFDAGAVGFIIANSDAANPDNTLNMSAADGTLVPIPGSLISFNNSAPLAAAIAAGEDVVVEWEGVGSIYAPLVPFQAVIPLSQALEEGQAVDPLLPSVQASYYNWEPADSIFTGTLSLETPSGVTTVIGSTLDTINTSDEESIVFQNAAIPALTEVGTYSLIFESSLPTANALRREFVVSDDYFQSTLITDDNIQAVGVADDVFNNSNGKTNAIGMLVKIKKAVSAKSFSFGICNGEALRDSATGNVPTVEVDLIQVDLDGDGISDLGEYSPGPAGSTLLEFPAASYIGFGSYEITGNESCDGTAEAALITIPLEPTDVLADTVVLQPGYYIVNATIDATSFTAPAAPDFLGTPKNFDFYGISFPVADTSTLLYSTFLQTSRVFAGFNDVDLVSRFTIADDLATKVSQPELAGEFSLSPNPADNFAVLRYDISSRISNGSVEVFSATGQLVNRRDLDASASGTLTLNTSGLSDGMYTVRISTPKGAKTLPLSVVKTR